MKPNELSELFNLSERRKYDIVQRGVNYEQSSNSDIDAVCRYGVIALVTDDDQDPDVFPVIDVAVVTGYKVEDGKRQFIIRKLTDLSVSCTVTNAIPLGNSDRPVVLNLDGTPQTCRVIGYRADDDYLFVTFIGDCDEGIIGLPLEGIQAIKKES